MDIQPPEPIDDGNAKTQVKGNVDEPLPEVLPPLPFSVSNTYQTLAIDQPRSLGSPAAAQLVAAHIAAQERRETSAQNAIRAARDKLDEANTKISRLETENGVLRSQLHTEDRFIHLRGMMNLLGGVLIGVGVDLYKNGAPSERLGIALALAGLALMSAASWVRLNKKIDSQ